MSEREIRYVHHRDKPVDILPEEAVAAIKDATAEVLWRTGIQVRSESLLKQLGAAGAEIDTEDERARFPKDVQAGALETVPHDLPLRSREPGLDLILDGTRGYLGVDGNAAEVVDLDTDLRRASKKEDVAAYRDILAADAKFLGAFVARWRERVALVTHARHRTMLDVVLGESLEHQRLFDQAAAGSEDVIGRRTGGVARVGAVLPDRWQE